MPRVGSTGTSSVETLHPAEPEAAPAAAPAPEPCPSAAAPVRPAALPEVLLQSARAKVIHGTDPGDYYCEHLFFLAQREAQRPGASVKRNASGEPLVGFLHVPPDEWTGGDGKPVQAKRHAGTREVVGAALKGYIGDAARKLKPDEPVKVLFTGYGTFMSTKNNPTGDFVSHPENVDAAMKSAFGGALLTKKAKSTREPDGSVTLRYRIRDEKAAGGERAVLVRTRQLDVADTTLDPANRTGIQGQIAAFQPHAVLSMGVHGGSEYKAEWHADDGGLREDGGKFFHDGALQARRNMPDNRSLARAILAGQSATAAAQP